LSSTIKIIAYLEDSDQVIRTFTPNNPPHGIRGKNGHRPYYASIVCIVPREELSEIEIVHAKEFILNIIPNALHKTSYSTIIKPYWFKELILSTGNSTNKGNKWK